MSVEIPRQEELLDVVDEQGNPTGQVLAKKDVHARELWHADVHVWLTDGRNNLLQQQRALDKDIMPGAWDISVGGHVGAGEPPLITAMRETAEELGKQYPAERFLPAGKLAVELAINSEEQEWLHRTVGEHYVVIDPGLATDELTLQTSEVAGARLYPIDQLEADLSSPTTATLHAPQPVELWRFGIAAIRAATTAN